MVPDGSTAACSMRRASGNIGASSQQRSSQAIHESRYAADPHHNKKRKIDRLAIGKSSQSIESNFRAYQSKAVHRAFVDSEEPKHAECSNALRSSVPARCFRRTVDAIHKGAGPGSNC